MEGGEDSFLTLTGACSQTQAQATTLDFKAAVRGSTTQNITLANPSITPWQLKPVIQNDYWSGPEVLTVPAGAEAAYAITYRPLSMSTPEKQHEGSVFFPIPDGSGLLYKLAGVAQSPMPAGTIQCQVIITARCCHCMLGTLQLLHLSPLLMQASLQIAFDPVRGCSLQDLACTHWLTEELWYLSNVKLSQLTCSCLTSDLPVTGCSKASPRPDSQGGQLAQQASALHGGHGPPAG